MMALVAVVVLSCSEFPGPVINSGQGQKEENKAMRTSLLLLVVALLSAAVPAIAQKPAGSVAFGFGLSNSVGNGECPFDDCGELGKSLSGEGAFNITENVAAVVGLGFGFANLSTSVSGIAIDASANSITFGGGVRGYGPPGQARAFGEVLAGYVHGTAKATAGGFRETASASGLSISPGAGVDIAVAERVAVRISGGVAIGIIEGETATSFGVGVGLVFGVGSR